MKDKKERSLLKETAYIAGYLSLLIIGTIAFWPVLWDAPYQRFLEAFATMKNYPWEGQFLFNGELLDIGKNKPTPWYYVPLWMTYTTPISYLLGFLLSFFAFSRFSWKAYLNPKSKAFRLLIFLALLMLPWGAIVYFKSIIYGEWRHLYFIYPALIVLAVAGYNEAYLWLKQVYRLKIVRVLKIGTIASIIGISLFKMIQIHPYQHSYFNVLAGNKLEGNWEIDIWALAYTNAVEQILQTDERSKIKLFCQESAGKFSHYLLPPLERERLVFVDDLATADYFLTTYFAIPNRAVYLEELGFKRNDALFEIRANNVHLLSAFKTALTPK